MEYQELLNRFQCSWNRLAEETFAQTLAENEKVRLFFINENQAFTDGKNIVVDPAWDELFADRRALDRTGTWLGWPRVVLADPWNALRIITRAQTIHECLHLLYTDFPGGQATDPKCDTPGKKKIMGLISNIIEDAYIEAAGCSCFDNMDFYLRFLRVSHLFAGGRFAGAEGRAFERLKEPQSVPEEPAPERDDRMRLAEYLNYMITFLLYPMVIQSAPAPDIAEETEQSKPLFLRGSRAASPAERYECASRAFDLICRWIPEDLPEMQEAEDLLGGTATHSTGASLGQEARRGRAQAVEQRLFADENGEFRESAPDIDVLMSTLQGFARDRAAAQQEMDEPGSSGLIPSSEYDCAPVHRGIRIRETCPKIDPTLRRAYQNIYNKYRMNIRSYCGRFAQLLRARTSVREEKQLCGSGINSSRLGDPKKRCWYRTVQDEDVPDLAVLLLVDGSGSMRGERRKAAMTSAVILHEVLKNQGIVHAIAEHRAGFTEPEIDVNILVRFDSRENEKLNIMQIDADGDNRDGLALFWAEKYMARNVSAEHRLIIVLSDGMPAHDFDDYYPPVSAKDTANAVKKITRRGTLVVGVSLDSEGEYDTYEQLSGIYPNLVGCNDLSKLTGQLLGIIAKLL